MHGCLKFLNLSSPVIAAVLVVIWESYSTNAYIALISSGRPMPVRMEINLFY